jgi:hypothetical protein
VHQVQESFAEDVPELLDGGPFGVRVRLVRQVAHGGAAGHLVPPERVHQEQPVLVVDRRERGRRRTGQVHKQGPAADEHVLVPAHDVAAGVVDDGVVGELLVRPAHDPLVRPADEVGERGLDGAERQPRHVVVDEEHPPAAGHRSSGQRQVPLAVGVDPRPLQRRAVPHRRPLPVGPQVPAGDEVRRRQVDAGGGPEAVAHGRRLEFVAAEHQQRPLQAERQLDAGRQGVVGAHGGHHDQALAGDVDDG